jgi:hypothetical protein
MLHYCSVTGSRIPELFERKESLKQEKGSGGCDEPVASPHHCQIYNIHTEHLNKGWVIACSSIAVRVQLEVYAPLGAIRSHSPGRRPWFTISL